MDWIIDTLESMPEVALFVCLAVGFAVGKVRVWKISLGGVAGTLIAVILIGMIGDIRLDDQVKTIAFAMFIFTLGYVSGPTFIASLNRKSLKYGVFTAIEVVSGLGVTAVAILIMNLDTGTAAGLLAGGATESAVVGTARRRHRQAPVAQSPASSATPGVTAVQQAAGNATPLMAYTIVYAFSNVALPLLGPVVVAMARAMGA